MEKHKKASPESLSLSSVGATVLVVILCSAAPYNPTFGLQDQPQQLASILIASSNQNITTPQSSSNANTSIGGIANGTMTISAPNASLVEFVSNIEQIKGHLNAALINKESGNNSLALAHVLHPIEEIYSNIEEQLANQNSTLNQTLLADLQSLSSSITNATLSDVENQADQINMLLNNSVDETIPQSDLDYNPGFNASVIARLLDTAGHEYEEGVVNGTVNAIVEYQDAQAFINRAESIFNASASKINQSMIQEVEQAHQFFSILNDAVKNKEDQPTIDTAINGIIDETIEITGLSKNQLVGEETAAAEQDPIAIINNIKSLLNQQLLPAYRSQDYEGAERVAIEAYLENYENIEAPLAEHDRQLMEQTEIMLREQLRQMIQDRVPIEQLEEQISMINTNLDKAAELLR
jgi:hypothetical protein